MNRIFCKSLMMRLAVWVMLLNAVGSQGEAANLTISNLTIGTTPLLGYNFGHFYPGSDTIDWWRYSGVAGARVFISPTQIEPKDELAPWGDGVSDQASFLARETLVRSDPWNTNYFNWTYVTNRFATYVLSGSDSIVVNPAFTQLRQLGVQILVNCTATAAKFTNMSSWPDEWELWHYYYEQAFYLGTQFDVQRYQIYNEPNGATITMADFLIRVQIASDAIQAAIADVNTRYGKTLKPMVYAPVTAGTATSTYASWGKLVVTNRHVNFLGQTSNSFELIQDYDYHQYGSGGAPSSFGTGLQSLQSMIASTMSPETPFPTSTSEFNVYDGSDFNKLSTTLDTPVNYSSFGSITLNLIKYLDSEIYCFKFSQTVGSGYPAKNGMHFVDNTNAPYNIGGITKGGEVWRLINKAFAPNRSRLAYGTDSTTAALDVQASYDAAGNHYYVLAVNNTTSPVSYTTQLGQLNLPTNDVVFLEEVSETSLGTGVLVTNLDANQSITMTQPANSVWLFTLPALKQQTNYAYLAAENAKVADGANATVNYGAAAGLVVGNNSTTTSGRSAVLIKFALPALDLANLQQALVGITSVSTNGDSDVNAYVYAITNNVWSETNVTWATAPNLAQNIAAGINYTNNFVTGIGTGAQLMGELIAGPSPGQKFVDVTSFLKANGGTNLSLLLARRVRYYGDTEDNDGLAVTSRQAGAGSVPTLQLFFNPLPVPPTITQSTVSATNGFTVTLHGTAGQMYLLQAATNLPAISWLTISTHAADTNGNVTLSDPQAGSFATRFYRAATP